MMTVRLNVIEVEINQSYQKSPFFIMLAKAGIQEFYFWIPASAGMTGEGEMILKLT